MADWEAIRHAALDSAPGIPLPPRITFPVVPQAVIRFSHLAENLDADRGVLAQTLEADSALTAELLRHVNTAVHGLRFRVHSVRDAIAAIGVRRSRTLVLTAAVRNAVERVQTPLVPPARFQLDNLERARFAHEAAIAMHVDAEMAYTAGLLQDLLIPLLMNACPDEYRLYPASEQPLVDYETDNFGWNHAAWCARVMHQWGFPDELVCGVLFHHQPERVLDDDALRHSSLAAAVAAAALPDLLNQSPDGLQVLLELQELFPEFNFLAVAAAVDDGFDESAERHASRQPLCERLGTMAIRRLDRHREHVRVHQKQLGNYALEEVLGQGGMGTVYRARHAMLKRPAALKLLHTNAISPSAIERFETEVQLTSRLTSPHTIGIYDYGVTPCGQFYYVMEYIDGLTLAELVQTTGPLAEGRTIHLLLQACASIGEAHAHGLIHRDIKPENLMLANRGGVCDMLKVLDFGLARSIGESRSAESLRYEISGTPLYMSPETITSPHTVDVRSDVYSLGAVGYFLLTGEPVFRGRDIPDILTQHVETRPLSPSARGGRAISADLEQIVMQCLEKKPALRPAGIAELVQLLNQCGHARDWTQRTAAAWWADRQSIVTDASAESPEAMTHIRTISDLGEIRPAPTGDSLSTTGTVSDGPTAAVLPSAELVGGATRLANRQADIAARLGLPKRG